MTPQFPPDLLKYIMLRNSFIHLPGVGGKTELRLWKAGVAGWDAFRLLAAEALKTLGLSPHRHDLLRAELDRSAASLAAADAAYFAQRLPNREMWRLFGDFHQDAAYLDIETNGLDLVTAVVVHRSFPPDAGPPHGQSGPPNRAPSRIPSRERNRGPQSRSSRLGTPLAGAMENVASQSAPATCPSPPGQTLFFVRDQNLHELPLHLAGVKLLVTYNGRSFDWPILQRSFARLPEPAAHLDLRYPFARMQYRGGLKGIEKAIGCNRPDELADIQGWSAVWLWQRHLDGDRRALPALLRYCAEDVLNLKFLAEWAYNRLSGKLPITVPGFPAPQRAGRAARPARAGEPARPGRAGDPAGGGRAAGSAEAVGQREGAATGGPGRDPEISGSAAPPECAAGDAGDGLPQADPELMDECRAAFARMTGVPG